MKICLPSYFSCITVPRVEGRCLHLLSDILSLGLCTYITGCTDYQEMRLFGLDRAAPLEDLLLLPNGVYRYRLSEKTIGILMRFPCIKLQ